MEIHFELLTSLFIMAITYNLNICCRNHWVVKMAFQQPIGFVNKLASNMKITFQAWIKEKWIITKIDIPLFNPQIRYHI